VDAVDAIDLDAEGGAERSNSGDFVRWGAVYKLHPIQLTHSLQGAWFQPVNLKRDSLVSQNLLFSNGSTCTATVRADISLDEADSIAQIMQELDEDGEEIIEEFNSADEADFEDEKVMIDKIRKIRNADEAEAMIDELKKMIEEKRAAGVSPSKEKKKSITSGRRAVDADASEGEADVHVHDEEEEDAEHEEHDDEEEEDDDEDMTAGGYVVGLYKSNPVDP
jgi:hypothetical protein